MNDIFIINPPDSKCLVSRITKDMAGGFGYETGDVVMLPPLDLIYHYLTLKKMYNVYFYDLQANPGKVELFFDFCTCRDNVSFLILVSIPTLESDIEFIKKIKDNTPGCRIFVKISHKNKSVVEYLINAIKAEKILFGETELIIDKIIEDKSRDGCAWLENGIIVYGSNLLINDMDVLPELDLSEIDIIGYKYILLRNRKKLFFTFQSSRGCPFSCGYYCPYPMVQGTKWRAMSAKKMYKNISTLVNNHKVKFISFRDATFTFDKKRTIDFCNDIIKNSLKFKWWCESRINCLDDELLRNMSLAGCKGINLGVESGDNDIMKLHGKVGADIGQLRNIKSICDKYKIRLHFLMIAGLPDETKKSFYNSLKIINELNPKSIGVSTITPYPGTKLFDDAVKNKWIIDNKISTYNGNNIVMKGKYLSAKQIEQGVKFLRLMHKYNKKDGWSSRIKKIFLFLYIYLWKALP